MPKKPEKSKQVFVENAGGTLLNGTHYDQVINDDKTRHYFILYKDGKILDRKPIVLLERLPKLEIFARPFSSRNIYPFNLSDRNMEPQPYGEVIDLWKLVRQYHYKHWDYHDNDFYDIVTAWTLATWLPEKFDFVVYIGYIGDSGTGKTRGLECLAALGYKAWLATSFNEAPLFRTTTSWHPTHLIDESEILTTKERTSVQNLLNAGQKRGVTVPRTELIAKGRYKVKLYELFGFKALAGTRKWLFTLQRRSIIAYCTQATRRVKRKIDRVWATEIRRKLLQYRIDYLDVPFIESEPKIDKLTEMLSGGIYELFFSLFSVAPSEKWNSILKYAMKEQEARKSERSTSKLAEVFFAILELKGEYIYVSQITDLLNIEREQRQDQYTNREVAKIASVLGFAKKHMRKGTVIIWNDITIARLKEQYGISNKRDDVTLTTQKTSNASIFATEDTE